jgi:hypothetical protein
LKKSILICLLNLNLSPLLREETKEDGQQKRVLLRKRLPLPPRKRLLLRRLQPQNPTRR